MSIVTLWYIYAITYNQSHHMSSWLFDKLLFLPCQLSVMIRTPSTFPLRNGEVDCEKKRRALLKRDGGGDIFRSCSCSLDVLLLWKQNVDKEFNGVEPCPVCYSVLCIKTHSMPNLECKICHNRSRSVTTDSTHHASWSGPKALTRVSVFYANNLGQELNYRQ